MLKLINSLAQTPFRTRLQANIKFYPFSQSLKLTPKKTDNKSGENPSPLLQPPFSLYLSPKNLN